MTDNISDDDESHLVWRTSSQRHTSLDTEGIAMFYLNRRPNACITLGRLYSSGPLLSWGRTWSGEVVPCQEERIPRVRHKLGALLQNRLKWTDILNDVIFFPEKKLWPNDSDDPETLGKSTRSRRAPLGYSGRLINISVTQPSEGFL